MVAGSKFVSVVGNPNQIPKARLLIESIRSFGGTLASSGFFLYELDSDSASCKDLGSDLVQVIPLTISDKIQGYPFAGKVMACADAERRLQSEGESLIWISPD